MKYFVTGTDTGIGKTVVSTILARGLGAHYWKPIQTGSIEGTDSVFVSRWIGRERVLSESYCYGDPVSPHLAARLGGTTIDISECVRRLDSLPDPLVIEGAGGVLVPLNDNELMIDLIEKLQVPVIVVTSSRLGTINHTLLTVEALKKRSIAIAGIVVNGPHDEAVGAMEAFSGISVIGRVASARSFSQRFFDQAFQSIRLGSCQ